MKVTIIIPTLNEEKFIKNCLESVFKQTYPMSEMEILVIDGGSKDKTRFIVSELARIYSNLKLLNNEGRIQSVAFNIGVKNSTSPIVIRLDAHALYHKDYVSLSVEHLLKNNQYGNVGGKCDIQPHSCTISAQTNSILNKVRFGIGGASYRVDSRAGEVDAVPFGAFPRKVIDLVGGMNEQLIRGEDNEYNYRIREAGYKIYFDPKIESTYFSRDTIPASAKQMFSNGVSIGNLMFLNLRIVRLRHIVPLAFVTSLVLLLFLSMFYSALFYLFVGILVLYTIANLIATLSACYKYGWKFIFLLPIAFFTIHVSYGIGTFIGMYKYVVKTLRIKDYNI